MNGKGSDLFLFYLYKTWSGFLIWEKFFCCSEKSFRTESKLEAKKLESDKDEKLDQMFPKFLIQRKLEVTQIEMKHLNDEEERVKNET